VTDAVVWKLKTKGFRIGIDIILKGRDSQQLVQKGQTHFLSVAQVRKSSRHVSHPAEQPSSATGEDPNAEETFDRREFGTIDNVK
jgi:hypothetical protein